jgi:regulator of replication initiation timing
LGKASGLAKANAELSRARDDLVKQVDDLTAQLSSAKDDAKVAQCDVETLKTKLAMKDAVPATSNDKALLEKVKELEEKKESLETALAEWTELAKVLLSPINVWPLLTVYSVLIGNIRTCCPRTSRLRSIAKMPATRSQRSMISSSSSLLLKSLSPMA